ncbi:DUF5931 domain-containing protein, partial [Saccharomonospora saliphila]|uniref:DUF5931 domain-containing protein n=1 Tax=Saccharomonospora saliphila TaxID=369829 RepID=UPI000378BAB0
MNSAPSLRDPATPLWWSTIVLRWVTLAFACGAVLVHHDGYRRAWLAWTAFAVMVAWTAVTSLMYSRASGRAAWFVVVDVVVTCAVMGTSPFVLSEAQYTELAPLVTTVWAAVPPLVAGARFGAVGGVLAGLVLA